MEAQADAMGPQPFGFTAAEVGSGGAASGGSGGAELLAPWGALASLAQREVRELREDHRLHAVFKSELDALEDKLSRQMASFRGQLMRQGERLTEAFLNPLQSKVSALEGRERKIDCQLSDLNGSVKGLVGEVQLQVRRADKTDAKLRHWRKVSEESYAKLEEQLQGKFNGPQAGVLLPPGALASWPSVLSPRQSPQAAPPQDAVTREELTQEMERLRLELRQEIHLIVDAALRDQRRPATVAEAPAAECMDMAESFELLRQQHLCVFQQDLAKEFSQVAEQVKAEREARLEELKELNNRDEEGSVPRSSPRTSVDLSAVAEMDTIWSKLQEHTKTIEAKVDRLTAESAPSRAEFEAVTSQRLARLAARVADLEGAASPPPRNAPAASVAPAVPRLDLSSVQTGSPGAWEGGPSPDASSLPGTDIASITAIVEDAVWTKLRVHLWQNLKSQEDLLDQLGTVSLGLGAPQTGEEISDPSGEPPHVPDLHRMYQTIQDVVELITHPGADPAADAGGAVEVVQPDSSGNEIVHLWRDELCKLWGALLEHIEHLELVLVKSGKAATNLLPESAAQLAETESEHWQIAEMGSELQRPADSTRANLDAEFASTAPARAPPELTQALPRQRAPSPVAARFVAAAAELVEAQSCSDVSPPAAPETSALAPAEQVSTPAEEPAALAPPPPPVGTQLQRRAPPPTDTVVPSVETPPVEIAVPPVDTVVPPVDTVVPPVQAEALRTDQLNVTNVILNEASKLSMDSYIIGESNAPVELDGQIIDITQEALEEQRRQLLSSSEALMSRLANHDKSIAEVRALWRAHEEEEEEDAVEYVVGSMSNDLQ